MTTLFLVRHGRTGWNKEQIFRGHKDIPLDEVGRTEARLVGERLMDERIKAVYSSPLSRAEETAQAIAQFHNLEVQNLEGLKDLNFGEWEGVSLKEVKKQYLDIYQEWLQAPHKVIFPGGEGLAAVTSRAMNAVEKIIQQHPQEAVALVSHRVVLKVLICALLGLDNSHFWNIAQDTTALNSFHHRNGTWICNFLNDTRHLQGVEEERGKVDF